MNPNEAKEEAKSRLSDYLSSKGINISTNFSCLNPLHEDKHPSMSFDSKRNRVHCFSCGADYDIFDVIRADTGLEGSQLFNHTYRILGINCDSIPATGKTNYSEKKDIFYVGKESTENQNIPPSFFEKCHKDVEKTDYWKKRGLSRETIDRFNLGYWEEKRRFVIPTGENSYNARAVDDVDKRFRYLKPKGTYEIFNLESVNTAKECIFIVEGEFDALSIIEVGGTAIPLGSSGNTKFLDYVKNHRPLFPFILCLDNDEAGRVGEQKLSEEFEKEGIDFVVINITEGYKDANEALVADREKFTQNVSDAKQKALKLSEEKREEEIEKYNETSAANGIGDFIQDIKRRYRHDCISTGFENFDEILDGGFYPGLYIIGAVSSLGKTTFALEIADNAAKNGQDVLVFSLEMGKQELISKSLSRLSFRKCKRWSIDLGYATTTRNLMNGKALETKEQADFMNEVLAEYAAYAGRIYYHIGIGDIGVEQIKRAIAKHIKITGKKPLVIIDYLQILSPYDMRATDKQNTDKSVVELKRASRDYDVPIFAISSFNRENYTAPVNLQSFKESGAIEYTSDVLMALQYKGMDFQKSKETGKYEDEKTRTARILSLKAEQEKLAEIPGKFQNIELKVLKNRNGRKGTVDMEFCPMFNDFEEPKKKASMEWTLRSHS